MYQDTSELPRIFGIEKATVPTLFYAIDSHIHSSWHKYFVAAFDQVLVAQKDFLPCYREGNKAVEWFPLWPRKLGTLEGERPVPACFCGNLNPNIHPKRQVFFEELQRLVPGDYGGGSWFDMYSRSKIVVNEVLSREVNYRVFEAMACGALLLCPEIDNAMNELFQPGEHYVPYDASNAEDAAQKIKWYLEHEQERKRIVNNAYAKICSAHSPMARAKRLTLVLESCQPIAQQKDLLKIASSYLLNAKASIKILPGDAAEFLHAAAETLSRHANLGRETPSEIIKEFEDISKSLSEEL